MEQTSKLSSLLKAYIDELTRASKASSLAELDDAKVKALKAYHEFSRQLNRAARDLQLVTAKRRSELNEAVYARVQKMVTVPISQAEETPVEVAVEKSVEKPKAKVKATGKTKKK